MIKFFRRIRQQLLEQNKMSKYLLYALGEIVLVVVGILIALTVNNWNQDRQGQKLGDNYLQRIHEDLVRDTMNFQRILVRNAALREDIKSMLVSLYDGVGSIEEARGLSAVYDQALDQFFSPNDKTYQDMVSSGTVGLIKNQELQEAIVDLYGEYDEKQAYFSAMGQWMFQIAAAVDIETDFIKFNIGAADIYTKPEMLNESDLAFLNDREDPKFKLIVRAISATAWNQQTSDAYYEYLIGRCKTVLQKIENELD